MRHCQPTELSLDLGRHRIAPIVPALAPAFLDQGLRLGDPGKRRKHDSNFEHWSVGEPRLHQHLSVMCRAAIWIALPACGTSWSPALGHSSSPQWRHLRIRLEPEPGRGLGAVSIFQDSNGLQHQMGLLRDAVPSLGGARPHHGRAHVGGRDEAGKLHSEDDNPLAEGVAAQRVAGGHVEGRAGEERDPGCAQAAGEFNHTAAGDGRKREIVVPLAMPAELTISVPPLEIVVPLAVPPGPTSCAPVNTIVLLANP